MPAPHDKTPLARAREKALRKSRQAYARMMLERELISLRDENRKLRKMVVKLCNLNKRSINMSFEAAIRLLKKHKDEIDETLAILEGIAPAAIAQDVKIVQDVADTVIADIPAAATDIPAATD